MFFSGGIPRAWKEDDSGRGGVYTYYANDTRFWIAANGQGPRVKFADAMRSSDFCFSPLGTHFGDTGE